MSTFNQGIPGVPTLINSSQVLLTGNAASANALTVRQFGAGNVFSAQTTSGTTALFVGANGNVGVGTTNPSYQLTVTSNIYNIGTGGGFYGTNCGNMDGLIQGVYNGGAANPDGLANSDLCIGVNYNQQTGQRLAASNHGCAQIQLVGTNPGPGRINFRCAAAGTGALSSVPIIATVTTTGLSVTGTISATGDITAFFSDDRLKTKTGRIESALEKVLSLEAFTYVPNDLAKSFGFEDSKQRVGLSAQSVQRVLPEAVCPAPFDADNKSGQGYLTVQYEKLVPLLVEAIKELAKQSIL